MELYEYIMNSHDFLVENICITAHLDIIDYLLSVPVEMKQSFLFACHILAKEIISLQSFHVQSIISFHHYLWLSNCKFSSYETTFVVLGKFMITIITPAAPLSHS